MNKYVSGIRPSGKLHLGNYLGAIRHWKALQDAGENTYFFIADMHGQYTSAEVEATYHALRKCGIKNIHRQSERESGLLPLMHKLSFHATSGRLDNMHGVKDSRESGESVSLFLYSYPVLMAADIILLGATHVPIGHDQIQHLELVRELARKIGRPEPEMVVMPTGNRIMDLKDPDKKMSKSNPNPNGIIYLCDSVDEIARKVKGAVSTPAGIMNLTGICRALGDNTVSASIDNYSGFKSHVTDLLVQELGANT